MVSTPKAQQFDPQKAWVKAAKDVSTPDWQQKEVINIEKHKIKAKKHQVILTNDVKTKGEWPFMGRP